MTKGKKKLLVIAGIFVLLLIIAIGIGVVYFEGIAKTMVMNRLDGMGFDASLDDLNIGIFGGTVQLLNFSLSPKDGERILLSEEISANLDFLKAIGGNILVEGFLLKGAEVNARVDEQGNLNLVTIAEDISKEQPQEEPQPKREKKNGTSFQINEIILQDVKVTVQDDRPDTPVEKLIIDLEEVNAQLAAGEVSLKNLSLRTSSETLLLGIDSLETKGKINPMSGEDIEVNEVYLSGLQGNNRLQSNGQFVVQQWAMDIAETNGLLKEATGEATGETEKKKNQKRKIPEIIEVRDVHYQLTYPGTTGASQNETVKLEKLVMRNNDLQMEGLAWNNEQVSQPVISLNTMDLKGALLDTPPVLQNVNADGLRVNLTKEPQSEFGVLQRINHLMELLGQGKSEDEQEAGTEEKQSPAIEGKIALKDVQLHVITDYGDGTTDDGISIGSSTVDFSSGDFSITQFNFSNSQGSFDNPSIAIDSIEGRSNLSYPLPENLVIDTLTVSSPDIYAVAESDGGVDLKKRLERVMDRGQQEEAEETSTETAQNINLKQLESSNLHILVRHELGENESIPYEVQNGELTVTDFVIPQAGDKTATADFQGDIVAPTGGTVSVDARSPQANFAKTMTLDFLLELNDVTALSPYYADKFPFHIQSGRFSFATDGSMDNKRLDFPYTMKIQSPNLKAKDKEGFDLFGNVTELGAQTLVDRLKNNDGDLAYSGTIAGTLDKPELSSPWSSMANLFREGLLNNVKNLSSNMITAPIDTSSKIIGGTIRGATEGVGKIRKETEKATETLKSLNPFAN